MNLTKILVSIILILSYINFSYATNEKFKGFKSKESETAIQHHKDNSLFRRFITRTKYSVNKRLKRFYKFNIPIKYVPVYTKYGRIVIVPIDQNKNHYFIG